MKYRINEAHNGSLWDRQPDHVGLSPELLDMLRGHGMSLGLVASMVVEREIEYHDLIERESQEDADEALRWLLIFGLIERA